MKREDQIFLVDLFLYGTTDFFLDYFGINSLEQLPEIKIPDSEDIETNLFESKYKEN